MLHKKIEALPQGEDFDFTFRIAAALHAGNAEWGYSCCNIPEIPTLMRHGTVFFSNNRKSELRLEYIRCIVSTLQPFANVTHLKIVCPVSADTACRRCLRTSYRNQ